MVPWECVPDAFISQFWYPSLWSIPAWWPDSSENVQGHGTCWDSRRKDQVPNSVPCSGWSRLKELWLRSQNLQFWEMLAFAESKCLPTCVVLGGLVSICGRLPSRHKDGQNCSISLRRTLTKIILLLPPEIVSKLTNGTFTAHRAKESWTFHHSTHILVKFLYSNNWEKILQIFRKKKSLKKNNADWHFSSYL